jgi:TRAP-type C4-dicarboxylate transport system substrate-binding protein
MVLFSKKIWDGYSPEEQKVLTDCATQARDVQRQTNRELNQKSFASLREKGMQVNELPEAEVARMREQAKPIYEKHAATIGKETVDKAMAELKRIRGATN